MVAVTNSVEINDDEISLQFIRSSGPGGQNVNKVATAVQLRFDLHNSTSLPADVKERLRRLARNRVTRDGVLVIEARRHRTQDQNREEAIHRLIDLVQRSLVVPKARRPTRPSRAAKAARVDSKKRRGAIKRGRRSISED